MTIGEHTVPVYGLAPLVSKLRVNKGTNRSLGDTNMRFGTNDPHILLIFLKVGARKK